jgi:RNA polymerase sigma factor (TIGR02999 family)
MDPTTTESVVEALLDRWRSGDGHASDELISLLYNELRGLAEHRLRMSPGHSIVPTELVHEAFVKLVQAPNRSWENRRHFINAAGTAMRSILVDRARAKRAFKRSPSPRPTPPGEMGSDSEPNAEMILAINDAIAALDRTDPRAAQVVTLRFFAGLTEPEMADVLGVNERTIRRDWLFARAWLRRHIDNDSGKDGQNRP